MGTPNLDERTHALVYVSNIVPAAAYPTTRVEAGDEVTLLEQGRDIRASVLEQLANGHYRVHVLSADNLDLPKPTVKDGDLLVVEERYIHGCSKAVR